MKVWIATLLSLGLINGCNSVDNINSSSETSEKTFDCPTAPRELPLVKIDREEYGFYRAFNYQIKEIVADTETIAFKSFRHKFTLCRGNGDWIVEEISPSSSENNLALGQYQNIQIEGKEYQYRVKLDRDSLEEAQQAIFELITPESSQPQQQVLYDLEETVATGAAIQLGEPEISTPIIYNDRLFWSVFTYSGEGFGGVATIVSYNPQTDQITVIKPPEIASQIINDLVITGNPDNPTFWIATQLTGEGNPFIPSLGLVAYRPNNPDYTNGTISSYRVDNSPIIGAITSKLYSEEDILWLGTGNGICQIEWQTIDDNDSWDCWRFAMMAELPGEGLPIYSSLLDDTADKTISPNDTNETVEVLWWLPTQRQPLQGRYEIEQETATIVELTDIGATIWDDYYYDDRETPVWNPPLYWAGTNWHWENNRFVRGLDEVELNLVGGGVTGISSGQANNDYIFDTNALRGDLELLELTKNRTKIKHYSAWVEDSLLQPYLTIVPKMLSAENQTKLNPLLDIDIEE